MANDDDFTFCRVGSIPAELDGYEAQDVVKHISQIHINDENANVADGGTDGRSGSLWKENVTSKKEEKVGSLSFNVIEASPRSEVLVRAKQVVLNDTGSSNKASVEQKTPSRKPASRAKVPFEKGYSQMDWMKLTRTHPDLAGLKGESNKRLISLNEVKQHQSEGSMWTVLKGRVYNIAPYMKFHPGGVDMLMKAVGKDCTLLFNKYHAWVNAEFLLEKCLVGILDDGQ